MLLRCALIKAFSVWLKPSNAGYLRPDSSRALIQTEFPHAVKVCPDQGIFGMAEAVKRRLFTARLKSCPDIKLSFRMLLRCALTKAFSVWLKPSNAGYLRPD